MTRTERIAKLKRDLASLRSRLLRIEGEANVAVREIAELQEQAKGLEGEQHA